MPGNDGLLGMDGKKGLLGRNADWKSMVGLKPTGRKKTPRKRDHGKPGWARMISVIIPAHNEEDYIGLTLDAVNRQNYPYFEVIVVANGCMDRTVAIAQG